MKTPIKQVLFLSILLVLAVGTTQAAIDPTTAQKLLASDGAKDDQFGYSVSVSGDTAVIGAYGADPDSLDTAGAAYVFIRSSGYWTQQARLIASDKKDSNWFGWSVSVSGDTAVIGAWGADPDSLDTAGAAYVFTRSGSVWTQQAKLIADDRAPRDRFGWSVSVSGDTAVVGAFYADPGGLSMAGAAYVFTRSGSTWTQQAKLTADDKNAWDYFGNSVSVDGDTTVIGAYEADPDNVSYAGAAYVFTRSGSVWTQQAKLTASDKVGSDQFGYSVSVSGNTTVIGANGADPDGVPAAGAAYVFTRSGVTWTQQAKLTASDKDVSNYFGNSVSVDGDIAVIGAADARPGDIPAAGAAYVFIRSGVSWTQQVKIIAEDGAYGDEFGTSVSADGNTVVIGAADANNDDILNAGAVYIYGSSGSSVPAAPLPPAVHLLLLNK